MSEFKVIKCKKCDAALTEIEGQKITQCVQCGYKFAISSQTTLKQSNSNIKNVEVSPGFNEFIKKLNQLKTQIATKKSSTNSTEKITKKKVPIWVSLVKWYFIIFFSLSVLSQCFNR
jgi:DNA-directed RNA polymerase subunit RPC12/RpoP